MKQLSAYLNEAADLIEAGHTKGVFARDEHNQSVDPHDPSACQFCALGALRRVAGQDDRGFIRQPYHTLTRLLGEALGLPPYDGIGITNANDYKLTKAEMVAAFRRAAESEAASAAA